MYIADPTDDPTMVRVLVTTPEDVISNHPILERVVEEVIDNDFINVAIPQGI